MYINVYVHIYDMKWKQLIHESKIIKMKYQYKNK